MAFALLILMLFQPVGTDFDTWNCSNTIEISCDSDGCKAQEDGAFTPMSVSFDEHGQISVCAYSGCWEGMGKVFQNGDFLTLTGNELEFSTSKDKSRNEDIAIILDRKDNIAMLKAGSFSHPLVCKQE